MTKQLLGIVAASSTSGSLLRVAVDPWGSPAATPFRAGGGASALAADAAGATILSDGYALWRYDGRTGTFGPNASFVRLDPCVGASACLNGLFRDGDSLLSVGMGVCPVPTHNGLCPGNAGGVNGAVAVNAATGKMSLLPPRFPSQCGLVFGSAAYNPASAALFVALDCLPGATGLPAGMQVVRLELRTGRVEALLSGADVPHPLVPWGDEVAGFMGSELLAIGHNVTRTVATLPGRVQGGHAATADGDGTVYAALQGGAVAAITPTGAVTVRRVGAAAVGLDFLGVMEGRD